MDTFILDSNTLTLLRHEHPRVKAAISAHTQAGDLVCVTSVNVEEVLGGWYAEIRRAKSPAAEAVASARLVEAVVLIATFPIVPATEPTILRLKTLRRLKLNIPGNDLRIAAIALELDATVVTNNARDFARVPDLRWADWSV